MGFYNKFGEVMKYLISQHLRQCESKFSDSGEI